MKQRALHRAGKHVIQMRPPCSSSSASISGAAPTSLHCAESRNYRAVTGLPSSSPKPARPGSSFDERRVPQPANSRRRGSRFGSVAGQSRSPHSVTRATTEQQRWKRGGKRRRLGVIDTRRCTLQDGRATSWLRTVVAPAISRGRGELAEHSPVGDEPGLAALGWRTSPAVRLATALRARHEGSRRVSGCRGLGS